MLQLMKYLKSKRTRLNNNTRQPMQIARHNATSLSHVNLPHARGLLHLLQLNSRTSNNNQCYNTFTRLVKRQRLMINLSQGTRINSSTTNKRVRRIRTILLRRTHNVSHLVRVPTTHNPIHNQGTRRRQRHIKGRLTGHVNSLRRRPRTTISVTTMLIHTLITRQIGRLQSRVPVHHVGLGHLRANPRHALHNVPRHQGRAIGLFSTRHTQVNRPAMHSQTQHSHAPSTNVLKRALPLRASTRTTNQPLTSNVIRLRNHRHTNLLSTISSPVPNNSLVIIPRSRVTQQSAPINHRHNNLNSSRTRSTRHTKRVVLMVRQHKLTIPHRHQVHIRQQRPSTITRNGTTRHRQLRRLRSPFTTLNLLLPLDIRNHPFLSGSRNSRSTDQRIKVLPGRNRTAANLVVSPHASSDAAHTPVFSTYTGHQGSNENHVDIRTRATPSSHNRPPLSIRQPTNSTRQLDYQAATHRYPPII